MSKQEEQSNKEIKLFAKIIDSGNKDMIYRTNDEGLIKRFEEFQEKNKPKPVFLNLTRLKE
jgi:hypothetical protein